MNKLAQYKLLVEKRKACTLCSDLCNPASILDGIYDSDQIGPWSCWQGKLDAEVMVVGQDWSDADYFREVQGRCKPSNPTNENLRQLLFSIGLTLKRPRELQDQVVFLTNLILCLKTKGGLQGVVEEQWFKNCSYAFFKPLVEIINPKIIIALGKKPAEFILSLYNVPHPKYISLSKMIIQSPYILSNSIALFPVYHCGARGINCNRSFSEQQNDWLKIESYLRNNYDNESANY